MPESDNATPYSASTYDIHVRQTLPYYDCFHQETINLLKAMCFTPKEWLDAGCGTGTLVLKALSEFPDTHFTLVDPSVQMMEAAKKKLSDFDQVTFLESSPTEELKLPKGSFDVVTAIQSHHYLEDSKHQKATSTCFDLLALKGVYVTFENIRPLTQRGTEIGKENWGLFQLASGKDKKTVDAHLERFGAEYYPLTVEAHIIELRKAGFSVVELLWFAVMQAGFYAIK
jgi:tRNA (cmo5U34)-methyltransferase